MTRSEITAFDVPAKFTIADDENCTGIIFDIAEKSPDRTVFRHKVDGRWTPVSARESADRIVAIAKGLIASGVNPGDRVALLSRTRLEWTLLDFAIWSAGAITVPILSLIHI